MVSSDLSAQNRLPFRSSASKAALLERSRSAACTADHVPSTASMSWCKYRRLVTVPAAADGNEAGEIPSREPIHAASAASIDEVGNAAVVDTPLREAIHSASAASIDREDGASLFQYGPFRFPPSLSSRCE